MLAVPEAEFASNVLQTPPVAATLLEAALLLGVVGCENSAATGLVLRNHELNTATSVRDDPIVVKVIAGNCRSNGDMCNGFWKLQ